LTPQPIRTHPPFFRFAIHHDCLCDTDSHRLANEGTAYIEADREQIVMTRSRREILTLAGTTAIATVGTQGWVTVAAQEAVDDELPAYSQWLTTDNGTLEYTHVDWAALEDFVAEELEEANPDEEVPEEYQNDPMIVPASDGLLSAYFFVGLTLAQYRLGRLLDADMFESTVDDLLQTNETFVLTGMMESAEIDDRLTAEPVAEFIRQMELTDAIGGYDVYTPVEDEEETAIALNSNALVVAIGDDEEDGANDPLTILESTIDVAAGDIDRATDESETVEWLVGTAGDGDITVGQYGDTSNTETFRQPEFEGLEDAEGIVSSLTVEDEETLTGDFAAIIDSPDEAALDELLGASADDQSVSVDGDRVTATARWREEVRYE